MELLQLVNDPFCNISKLNKIKHLKLSVKTQKKLSDSDINSLYFFNSDLYKISLKDLNKVQLEIVLHKEGSILVSAVPGAGKTKVVSKKVAYLISHCKINPTRILVITFTKKAANELKERIGNMIKTDNEDDLVIGTFHSICHRFIKSLKIEKNFTVLDDEHQKSIINNLINKYKTNDKPDNMSSSKNIKDILYKISEQKNKLVAPEEFKKVCEKPIDGKIYEEYIDYLNNHNYLDFDDLINILLRAIRTNSAVREFIENRFDYVFIDEFQDTNTLQFDLISHFAKRTKNIMVVGDTDQSIYAWRFADPKIITKFNETFKNYKLYQLEQNYRSTKHIIECNNSIIKQDLNRLNNRIWTQNEDGEKVILHQEIDQNGEVKFIANEIKKLKDKGINYDQMVILIRTNWQSRIFETIFSQKKIPYQLIESKDFYKNEEIQYVLSFLRFIVNRKDVISFKVTVNASYDDTMMIINEIEKNGWDNIILNDKIAKKIKSYINLIDECDKLIFEEKIVSDIILHILEKTNYKRALELEYGHTIAQEKWECLSELVNFATRYYTIETFLMDTQLTSECSGKNALGGKVSILTIHSAKGLEWDIVFIPSIVENIIPLERSINSGNCKGGLDEERRLLYVAMTRAKKQLFLTHCRKIMNFGKTAIVELSRFLKDLPNESITIK